MKPEHFDFIVVGGGSAGYAAARTAAEEGLRVAVVEGGQEVGGLCILRGCMPSKALIESANRYETLRHASKFGLSAPGIGYDAAKIQARKRELIADFAGYRKAQLEAGKFTFFRGRAVFESSQTVSVRPLDGSSSFLLHGRAFLIATGSVINRPEIPGIDLPGIWTSDDVLALEKFPESVIVLGAGPVGLESAHFFSAFGIPTTVLQRSAHVLRASDQDVSDALAQGIRARGTNLLTGVQLVRIEKDGALFVVSFTHEGRSRTVSARAVVNALGRRPAISGLGLDAAGVALDGGGIKVDFTQQTSAPHIFAAGDVCGPFEIVHLAIQQGETAARNAARRLRGEGEAPARMDYRLKVFAVFTEPQMAACGAHEAELHDARRDFRSAKYPFADHGKSMTHGETDGFVKLLADAATGEILGGAVVGPHASELIHEVVVAMRYRSTVHEFALIPHYHPTLSEIWTYPAENLAEICDKRSISRFPS